MQKDIIFELLPLNNNNVFIKDISIKVANYNNHYIIIFDKIYK